MTINLTLSARRSFSRPWPIKMVLALIKPSRSFCTSLSDLTELFPRFRSRAVTPENRVLQSIIVSSGRMMVSYTSLPSIPTTVTENLNKMLSSTIFFYFLTYTVTKCSCRSRNILVSKYIRKQRNCENLLDDFLNFFSSFSKLKMSLHKSQRKPSISKTK